MTRPRVSVVVTTRNRGRMLAACLDSVYAQTLADLEIIVVDDASDDGSWEDLVRLRSPRLRAIRLATRRGSAAARNAAMRLVRGKLTAFVDDDDLWRPRKLERQLAAFEDPAVHLVHSDFDLIDAAGRLVCRAVMTCPRRALDASLDRRRRWIVDAYRRCPVTALRPMPQISTAVVRTRTLERMGPFDEEFPRVYYDLDMWLRIRAARGPGSIRFIAEPLASHRVHARQISDTVSALLRGPRARRVPPADDEQFGVLVENLLFGARFSSQHYYCRAGRHVCKTLPASFKVPSRAMRALLPGAGVS